jgi:uncharacterized RDD family membrane protein YckC
MKQMAGMKRWVATALLVGTVCFHSPLLRAVENATTNSAAKLVETLTGESNVVLDESVALIIATNVVPPSGEEQSPQHWRGPVVVFGGTASLQTNESAEVVVAIGGSAKAGGKVRDAVVAIGGNASADSDVGDAVVAIGGNAVARGKVGDALVAIGGDAEANGQVGDAVVAIFGNVRIGSNSVVHGDAVAIGGKVEVAEGGQLKGQPVEIGVRNNPLLAPLKGLTDWFKDCVLKLRLLAPKPGWYWVVAGFFLLCYLLITVAFPRPVAACVNELTQRPATTFLLGLLTKLLVPLVVLVLATTGVGLLAVPFVGAAIFIGSMIGKAALFQYLGRGMARVFGAQMPNAVLAMLAGFVLITLLYLVPLLSLLVYTLTGIWGIGAAVTASFGGMRKETPARLSPTTPPFPPAATAPATAFASSPTTAAAAGIETAAFAAAAGAPIMATSEAAVPPVATSTQVPPPPKPMSPLPVAPVASEALTLPRANFWERMGAAFLDVILVSILGSFVGGPPLGFLVALAYFAGMWAWKGTTIGGIVLNLKVVRLDDKPVTFLVALVRGLASAFSVIILFLGFFWMIWDREKQTWHDKIAGTVVVRQPRGMPLVCL